MARRVVAAAASLLWAGLLPSAAAGASQSGVIAWMAFLTYGIGSIVCHQRPERSFHWGAAAWPVCARCTGIYAGAAIAATVGLFARGRALGPARARAWLAAAAVPVVCSLGYEWSTGVTPSNATRAATGLLVGSVAAWVAIAFLADDSAGVSRADETGR